MACGRIRDQRVEAVKHPPPVRVEHVERPGPRQHFHRALADALQVHAAGEIEQGNKWLLRPRRDDHPHRLDAHVLQGTQRIDDLPVPHAEHRL